MPSKETVDKVLRTIKRSADNEYFFSQIKSPEWIVPLRDRGIFSDPPSVAQDGNYYYHPTWHESKYLLRMAEQAPEDVLETVLRIPDCDNERVHQDYVQIALHLPPDKATEIAKRELQWIKSQSYFNYLYPEYVGKLLSYLAKGGKIVESVELARELLGIDQTVREFGRADEDSYQRVIEITGKFSTWEYGQILDKYIPDIVEHGGFQIFKLLSDLLEKAILLDSDGDEPPIDYSSIWRSAIEDHEQNRTSGTSIKDTLVSAVRDASIKLVAVDQSHLTDIIEYLKSKPWFVFKRITLYLVSKYADAVPDITAMLIMDHNLFDNSELRHEYAQLSYAGFSLLRADQKKQVLDWLEKGPDLELFKSRVREHKGRDATEDEVTTRIGYWQRDNLELFKSALPSEWQEKYDSLIERYGEPEHNDFSGYHTSWVGPTSPMSVDDLKQLSVNNIIDFFKNWDPPEGDMVDSPEGLSRILETVVSQDPIRFAKDAVLFESLDPTYVRGLVNGFRDVPSQHKDIPWEPILELCKWIVDQPRAIPGRTGEYVEFDPGWVWTRKSVANLLSNGLKAVVGEIQIECREQIWAIIEILTNDPDPENEDKDDGYLDPSSLSINSVRGEAMHAVMHYGLWIHRHADDKHRGNFSYMPEVQTILERHLDTQVDPFLAIRSVYGQWFPWLHLMDPAWTKQSLDKIFPPDSEPYWDTAWKTYVTFCRPFNDVFEVLKPQYEFAVNKIGRPSTIKIDLASADERLGEHLMSYFWRGQLLIDDSLLVLFYDLASVELKGDAIDFIGHSLKDMPDTPEEDVRDRLRQFWEWRYKDAVARNELDELSGFCWWFYSGKLDANWALNQLQELLNLDVKLELLDFVAKELVNHASTSPMEVLECLGLMVKRLEDRHVYFSWSDEAMAILEKTKEHESSEIRARVTNIAHQLGSMGSFEFRSLV